MPIKMHKDSKKNMWFRKIHKQQKDREQKKNYNVDHCRSDHEFERHDYEFDGYDPIDFYAEYNSRYRRRSVRLWY